MAVLVRKNSFPASGKLLRFFLPSTDFLASVPSSPSPHPRTDGVPRTNF